MLGELLSLIVVFPHQLTLTPFFVILLSLLLLLWVGTRTKISKELQSHTWRQSEPWKYLFEVWFLCQYYNKVGSSTTKMSWLRKQTTLKLRPWPKIWVILIVTIVIRWAISQTFVLSLQKVYWSWWPQVNDCGYYKGCSLSIFHHWWSSSGFWSRNSKSCYWGFRFTT